MRNIQLVLVAFAASCAIPYTTVDEDQIILDLGVLDPACEADGVSGSDNGEVVFTHKLLEGNACQVTAEWLGGYLVDFKDVKAQTEKEIADAGVPVDHVNVAIRDIHLSLDDIELLDGLGEPLDAKRGTIEILLGIPGVASDVIDMRQDWTDYLSFEGPAVYGERAPDGPYAEGRFPLLDRMNASYVAGGQVPANTTVTLVLEQEVMWEYAGTEAQVVASWSATADAVGSLRLFPKK